MPTLHWIGKDKVINHHLDVPYKVSERKYSYGLGVMKDTSKYTHRDIARF